MEKGQSYPPVMSQEIAQTQVQVKGQNQIMSQSHNNAAVPVQTNSLLEVKDLRVEYLSPKGPVRAVDGVSFSIGPGEVLGLAGESGSGKSTIAHALLRVLRPPALITGGEVYFKGKDVLSLA
jgi:peptide/nickel transport system ATP-binding protein